MPKFASVTAQRAKLLQLHEDGIIDSAILRESLASLARETADPPAAPAPAPALSKSAKKRARRKKKATTKTSKSKKKT